MKTKIKISLHFDAIKKKPGCPPLIAIDDVVIRIVHRRAGRRRGAVAISTPVAGIAASGLIAVLVEHHQVGGDVRRRARRLLLGSQDGLDRLPVDVDGLVGMKHVVRVLLLEHALKV